jgi:hypothetical protein
VETKVSTKGTRGFFLARFGVDSIFARGDPLEVKIENGHIVLTPQRKRPYPLKLVTDPVTGLPALTLGRPHLH